MVLEKIKSKELLGKHGLKMKPDMEGSDGIKMATQWFPTAVLLTRTTSNFP